MFTHWPRIVAAAFMHWPRIVTAAAVLCIVPASDSQQRYAAEEQHAMASPPLLPVVTAPVLPGEGWGAGPYVLRKAINVFDTWKSARVVIAHLPEGSSVLLVSGLCQVDAPDVIEVTASVPSLLLNRGDRVLRYTQRGEGNADFWANGRWYTDGDLGWVKDADGSGCQSGCKAEERKPGRFTWWFKIRLRDGRRGWTESLGGPNLH